MVNSSVKFMATERRNILKKGLVLEGGAMRGLFTAGVTDAMMEHGIVFDGVIGVSAGACFGCNYKSGQKGRALRYNVKYCNDPRYCSLRSLIKTGDMYGGDFCYHELPEKLDVFDSDAFEKSPVEFYIVCTDVETGKPVYHKMDKCDYTELEWMRACASMPLVSRIVEIDGMMMLDGGVSDSVPLEYFQSIGFEKNVVVLTQPRGYIKKANSLMPLIRMKLKKYPKLVEAMHKRHIMYNKTLEYIWDEEKKGNVLVLCPEENLPIKRVEHKAEKLTEVYNMGRCVFEKNSEKVKYFCEKH